MSKRNVKVNEEKTSIDPTSVEVEKTKDGRIIYTFDDNIIRKDQYEYIQGLCSTLDYCFMIELEENKVVLHTCPYKSPLLKSLYCFFKHKRGGRILPFFIMVVICIFIICFYKIGTMLS